MTSRPVLLPAQLRGASFGTSVKKVKPATKTGANRELPQPSSAKREQVRPYFEPVPEREGGRSYFTWRCIKPVYLKRGINLPLRKEEKE
jgi:hypothetical protein